MQYFFEYDNKGSQNGFHFNAETDAEAIKKLRYYGSGKLFKQGSKVTEWVLIFKKVRS